MSASLVSYVDQTGIIHRFQVNKKSEETYYNLRGDCFSNLQMWDKALSDYKTAWAIKMKNASNKKAGENQENLIDFRNSGVNCYSNSRN